MTETQQQTLFSVNDKPVRKVRVWIRRSDSAEERRRRIEAAITAYMPPGDEPDRITRMIDEFMAKRNGA